MIGDLLATAGILATVGSTAAFAASIDVAIDPADVRTEISPYLYGTGMEDINHEIYGGLDAQRLYGESFEESPLIGSFSNFDSTGEWYGENAVLRGNPDNPSSTLTCRTERFPANGWVELLFQFPRLDGVGGLRIGAAEYKVEGWTTYDTKSQMLTCPLALRVSSANGKVSFNLRGGLRQPEPKKDVVPAAGDPIVVFGQILVRALRINDGTKTTEVPLDYAFATQASRWWQEVTEGKGRVVYDCVRPRQGRAAQVLVPNGGSAGLANRGLKGWGVPCVKGRRMVGYVHARGAVGALEVVLQSKDGTKTYAMAKIDNRPGGDWRKLSFSFTPSATDPQGRFLIKASGTGKVGLDDVYLADEPTNEFGRLGCREDIVAAFQKEGLNFVRWGGTMANADEYLLKNLWGNRTPYIGHWYRYSSGGFGPREFVAMAAAMKVPCAFSISVHEDTVWAVRLAEWLKRFDIPICVQIGNEERLEFLEGGDFDHYCDHCRRLVGAMKKANPKLTFASAANWNWNKEFYHGAFRSLDGLIDYWDIHIFIFSIAETLERRSKALDFMKEIRGLNPKTTMKVAMFEENGDKHNMERALCHALVLSSMREVGTDLLAACTANAMQAHQQNDNGWDQGGIHFTPDKVWLAACAWAKRMAADNHRELLVGSSSADTNVFVSATRDRGGSSVVAHFVNISGERKELSVSRKGMEGFSLHKVTELAGGSLAADNTREEPERVIPRDVTARCASGLSLEPYSYTIVEWRKGKGRR